jgi:hypothetical protein
VQHIEEFSLHDHILGSKYEHLAMQAWCGVREATPQAGLRSSAAECGMPLGAPFELAADPCAYHGVS